MVIPVIAELPADVQKILFKVVKPKFDAYLAFTSSNSGGLKRAVPDPNGQPWFWYPNETMISDLVVFSSLFNDIYEAVGGPEALAALVKADNYLQSQVQQIVEGTRDIDPNGSFWEFPTGQISYAQAIEVKLPNVLRTLRNGFAHCHGFHADLSAADYWSELGWDTARADSRFNVQGRPRSNYVMYIADAEVKVWKPENFWVQKNLRILITRSGPLRYYLHLLLNFILNGSKANVFDNLAP